MNDWTSWTRFLGFRSVELGLAMSSNWWGPWQLDPFQLIFAFLSPVLLVMGATLVIASKVYRIRPLGGVPIPFWILWYLFVFCSGVYPFSTYEFRGATYPSGYPMSERDSLLFWMAFLLALSAIALLLRKKGQSPHA